MYYSMEIKQGSDFTVSFTVKDPDTGNPIDIRAGYTVSGKIAKTEYNDSLPLYTWPIGPNGLLRQEGRLVVKIPGSVSRTWDFERVKYGIKVVQDATGAEVMGIDGDLTIIHTVE